MGRKNPTDLRPIHRGRLRHILGQAYYTSRRFALWYSGRIRFSGEFRKARLPHRIYTHATPLLRKLKDLDMQYQHNKITNLRIATARMDGMVIHPGETSSFWKQIGRPTARKGYLEGIVLFYGAFMPGVGGGLCQLSNLIYWMTLHTRLTVVERYRHSFDVFPDSNRVLPFGRGATCVYPYRDLMIRNDTDMDFQLSVCAGEDNLEGEWFAQEPTIYKCKGVERMHHIQRKTGVASAGTMNWCDGASIRKAPCWTRSM